MSTTQLRPCPLRPCPGQITYDLDKPRPDVACDVCGHQPHMGMSAIHEQAEHTFGPGMADRMAQRHNAAQGISGPPYGPPDERTGITYAQHRAAGRNHEQALRAFTDDCMALTPEPADVCGHELPADAQAETLDQYVARQARKALSALAQHRPGSAG